MLTPFAFWQQPTTGVASATQSLLWGMVRFGSTNSAYSLSSTASTWTNTNIGANSNYLQMSYSDPLGLYVAVSETLASQIRRTSDMITWTASFTLPTGNGARSIIWIDDLNTYIVGGITGSLSAIWTSSDGISYTKQSTPAAVTGYVEQLVWASDKSLAVAVTLNSKVMTSPDGVTWTERTAATGQWHGVGYGNGIFVAGGINGYLGTSSDGISWNVFALAGSWRRIAYSPTLNLFVGTRYTGTIAYSSNGSSWTASNSGTANWWDVIWVPQQGRFAATRLASTQPVLTSTDGINWTAQTTTLTSGSWVGIQYRKQIT